MVEEIKKKLDSVLVELQEIKNNNFQLSFPLDVISKSIIKDLFVFPVVTHLEGQNASSASLYGIIFSADRTYVLESIAESHGTAASNGTLQFVKMVGVQSISSGSAILVTTFDLTTTAGTARIRNLGEDGGFATAQTLLIFNKGDRLGMKPIGTLASLQDLQITSYFKYA